MKKNIIYFGAIILNCILTNVFAQTSGPVQPEVQSFKPIDANELVNTFTGDFSYNIPLFELPGPDGGYPFNLFYNGGITMTQEASWVGLGWNLNPGVINRDMRNIPDEFNGEDKIVHYKKTMKSWTFGIGNYQRGREIAGVPASEKERFENIPNIYLMYNNISGFSISIAHTFKLSNWFSLSLKTDNSSGLTINPNLSFGHISKSVKNFTYNGSFSLGLNINSITGINNLSLMMRNSASIGQIVKSLQEGSKGKIFKLEAASGASYSFSDRQYPMTISDEYKGDNTNIMIGGWKADNLTFKYNKLSGNYFVQKDINNGIDREISAFGFNHLGKFMNSDDKNKVVDFVRESDEQVSLDNNSLSVPVSMPDLYSISSQGMNATFHSVRQDIGFFYDNPSSTISKNRFIGIEVGVGSGDVHVGFEFEFGKSTSESNYSIWGDPKNNNFPHFFDWNSAENKMAGNYFEPFYYKIDANKIAMNKSELNQIYNIDIPEYFKIDKVNVGTFEVSNKLDNKNNIRTEELNNVNSIIKDRVPRTDIVQYFTNFEIGTKQTSGSFLKLFDFKYFESENKSFITVQNAGESLSYHDFRKEKPGHHTGGFEVIKTDGTRYIFALPVYNNEKVEVKFSSYGCDDVKTGNCPYTIPIPMESGAGRNDLKKIKSNVGYQILDIQTTPQYAASYLLTAIVGPDYVDVKNDGLTDDDLGYWVKFNYVKTSDNYIWKAPFYGANFIMGQESLTADNMGLFTCGQREMWYLLSAETKTHIAEFELSRRNDARGAASYTQNHNDNELGEYSYKIDKIKLFSKLEHNIPIQTVQFNFAETGNELCQHIDNNALKSQGGGKLTLTKVAFSHRNNTRAVNNPYEFYYSSTGNWNNQNDNPDYQPNAMDRWGAYQKDLTGRNINCYFPYTRQNNPEAYSSSWHLKRIKLPSMSVLQVDYESNDYFYIQNKTASLMYKITDYNINNGINNDSYIKVDIGNALDKINPDDRLDYIKYLLKQENSFLFRIYADLGNENKDYENVTGVFELNKEKEGDMELNGNILTLYVKNVFGNDAVFHPFQKNIYNYIKLYRTDLFTKSFNKPTELNSTSGEEIVEAFGSLLVNFPSAIFILTGLDMRCKISGFGKDINLNDSYVRLPVFNGYKKGGGCRVRCIKLFNSFNDIEPVTGSVYEYNKEETFLSGNKEFKLNISSGVAQNEPSVGIDESTLYNLLPWTSKTSLITSVTRFNEYPYNNSYFPAPQIGYSQVKVYSLPTFNVVNKSVKDNYEEVRTTGMTVYNFYTAKDFPVCINKTLLSKGNSDNFKKLNLPNLTPMILDISFERDYIYASQGYLVEINDMHGKIKKVCYYGQDEKGNMLSFPYSWQEYIYKTKPSDEICNNKSIGFKLSNDVSLMCSEGVVNEQKELGVHVQQFYDLRYLFSKDISVGGDPNVDIWKGIAFTVSGFPSMHFSKSYVGTCVNNKVITRSGILEKVISFDQGTYTEIKNEVFDELTGEPVLVSTTKSQDLNNPSLAEKTYKYDIQGHWMYEGMDGAYKNTLHEIIPSGGFPIGASKDNMFMSIDLGNNAADILKYYYQGDEILICPYNGSPDYSNMAKAVVMGTQDNKLQIEIIQGNIPLGVELYIKVVRPGRRNLVGQTISTIVTTKDPFLNRTSIQCKP